MRKLPKRKCFLFCSRGQLGHGTTESCARPTVVEALDGLTVLSVAAGGWHSAAVTGRLFSGF